MEDGGTRRCDSHARYCRDKGAKEVPETHYSPHLDGLHNADRQEDGIHENPTPYESLVCVQAVQPNRRR